MRIISLVLWGGATVSVVFFGGANIAVILFYALGLVLVPIFYRNVWVVDKDESVVFDYVFLGSVLYCGGAISFNYGWLWDAILIPSVLMGAMFGSSCCKWPRGSS